MSQINKEPKVVKARLTEQELVVLHKWAKKKGLKIAKEKTNQKTEQIQIRLTKKELNALHKLSEYNGVGMSSVLCSQIRRSAEINGLW